MVVFCGKPQAKRVKTTQTLADKKKQALAVFHLTEHRQQLLAMVREFHGGAAAAASAAAPSSSTLNGQLKSALAEIEELKAQNEFQQQELLRLRTGAVSLILFISSFIVYFDMIFLVLLLLLPPRRFFFLLSVVRFCFCFGASATNAAALFFLLLLLLLLLL